MENQSKEKELYLSLSDGIEASLEDKDAKEIFDALKSGKNTYLRTDRVESSSFDLTWIENIEKCLYDLGSIVNNPRSVTKTTADLTPVELAKKTNAESVMHLASHTQYIKDIDENGNVIPNKILSIGSDDELKTYENRFVATLIRKLVLFVEKRYEYVKSFSTLMDHEQLFFKNQSVVRGSNVRIETKVIIDSPKKENIRIKSNEYVQRIEEVRKYILYYYNSRFMKIFKTDRNVKNPILQTNIIRKNPTYHHCYELYLFIEAYDKLGVNYTVNENFRQFSEDELMKLNDLTFINYLSLQGKDKEGTDIAKETHFQPTVLTSSDDEEFVYGPLLTGPISFVRADKEYQKYLDSRTEKDLPKKPSRHEYLYFKDDYQARLDNRLDLHKLRMLQSRKENDKLVFDQIIQARIAKMEEELEFLKEKRMKKRHEEEEEYLARFRSQLADRAKDFMTEEHDFGHYVTREEYENLTNGIGLSDKTGFEIAPYEEEVELVSEFQKDDVEVTLLEEETLKEERIVPESIEVDTIEDTTTIIPVKEEMDYVKDLIPVEKEKEKPEPKEEIKPIITVRNEESEAMKALRLAEKEEMLRLLDRYQKEIEEGKKKQEPKTVIVYKDRYLQTYMINPSGTMITTCMNKQDDEEYHLVEKTNHGEKSSELLTKLSSHLEENKRNRNVDVLPGKFLEETIRKDQKFQNPEAGSPKEKESLNGHLSNALRKDTALRSEKDPSIKDHHYDTSTKASDSGLLGKFREFGK